MGILFLTVKQEGCSDLLLWSAAWLLPPLRLMPMLMPTTATAMALDSAMLVSATLDWAMVDTVLDMEATVIPVLATLTARGRLRLSPRLMPSTDTELTPTPLVTVTPVSAMLPLPLPPLPSLPLPLLPLTLLLPPLLPTPLLPLPSATPVSDTLVSDTLVSDTLVLATPTARGRPRLSPRLMLTTATGTVSDTDTPVSDTATLVLATATVLEPTELDTDTTTVKLVQLSSRSSTQSLPSVLLLKE